MSWGKLLAVGLGLVAVGGAAYAIGSARARPSPAAPSPGGCRTSFTCPDAVPAGQALPDAPFGQKFARGNRAMTYLS